MPLAPAKPPKRSSSLASNNALDRLGLRRFTIKHSDYEDSTMSRPLKMVMESRPFVK
jgi:hypothetical protein